MSRHTVTRRGSVANRRRDERGAVAIIIALCMTVLCLIAALVLDFGQAQGDRQVDKSAADSAVLAGLHAMDFTHGSNARPFVGVCAALQFLKANGRFTALPENSGWSYANGTAIAGDPCTDSAMLSKTCTSASSSWARYQATPATTSDGFTYTVTIQNGYDFADVASWKEDSLPATSGDRSTDHCMDFELTIRQGRPPGFGSLATSHDLRTGIRTVGRVTIGPNGDAPAMLLLKQSGCVPNALINGGSGFIHVLGVFSATGSQGGTIHSDDNGTGCGTGGTKQILYGRSGGGIAAYAAPSCAGCTTPDPSKPGTISTVAGSLGTVPSNWIIDAIGNVYGATGTGPASPGTTSSPVGRALVTRQPVDARYKATVQSIMASAQSNIFSKAGPPVGWATVTCTGPGNVAVPAYDATKVGLWIVCGNVTGVSGPIAQWKTVVFSGRVTASSTAITMPDATKVYVFGASPHAITASGGGGSFQMHTTGLVTQSPGFTFPDGKQCPSSNIVGANRGLLVVKNGDLNASALFRACDTTVVMMGNDTAGCVPTYDATIDGAVGPAPSLTPCPSASKGTGQVNISGDADWTAPSECSGVVTSTTCDGVAFSPVPGGWGNPNGPEDLALWTESYATDSGGTTSRLGGSANVNVRGVFMSPNFDPLVFGGGGTLRLTNAQFVSASLSLNGGTQLTMSVDPNSAVKLKSLLLVGLVR